MSVGTRPRITVSSSWRRPITGIEPSRPWVYGCIGSVNSSLTDACSTIWPPYITATRWAISATTPRSWVISTTLAPGVGLQLAHQVEDLGLDRDVEGGRRLVGDQQLGLGGERHGDHHPLRLAAGELVRVGLGAPFGVGDADAAQHLDRLLEAVLARCCCGGSRRPR